MLGVGENTRLLQRYEVLERTMMRFNAGWAMATHAWDVKVMLGRHMWQDAERADRLRTRLKELRSGPLDLDNQSGLEEVVNYAARANHTAEYIAGMYGVIKAALLDAYRLHRELTDIFLDDATLEALSLNILSLEEQCRWTERLPTFELEPPYDQAECDCWRAAVAAKLALAGNIDGSQAEPDDPNVHIPERPPFQRPHEQRLDGFVMRRHRDVPPTRQEGEEWREYVFRTFMNEIGAGDNVASILFDAPTHVEWGFLYDIARHGWDEYRHASMGRQRLRQLGYEPTSFPLGTGVFEFRDRLPLLDRLGMLVLSDESSAFGYKHGSRKFFRSIGDQESEEYMMYDISDETRHVKRGRKWIEYLQEALGDTRTVDQLQTDMERLLQERIEFIGTGHKN